MKLKQQVEDGTSEKFQHISCLGNHYFLSCKSSSVKRLLTGFSNERSARNYLLPDIYKFQQEGEPYHYHNDVIPYLSAEVPVWIGRGGVI
ncbi:hypothetical protein TNCV_120041 [Trichonephila clavipes]|nr:hypothetical protein TNCV_120041 [Trichonephila clavipes]